MKPEITEHLSFIDYVDSYNSGGNCLIDYVKLSNGKVIGITDESVVIYNSMDEFLDLNPTGSVYIF